MNPDAPGHGCGSASTGRGPVPADGWVLAEVLLAEMLLAAVLLATPVHADAAAKRAAAATAGSQGLGVT